MDDKLGVFSSIRDLQRVAYRHRPRRTPAGLLFPLLALVELRSASRPRRTRGERRLPVKHLALVALAYLLILAVVAFFLALVCYAISAAIYIAMNDLVFSAFTFQNPSFGN